MITHDLGIVAGTCDNICVMYAGRIVEKGTADEIFKNGVIDIYSGSQPADADAVEIGTKLVRVTVASGAFVVGEPANGLNFATAAEGGMAKEGDVWSGLGLADNTLVKLVTLILDHLVKLDLLAVLAPGSEVFDES